MLALERKQKIIERLRQDRKVYVGELSRELDVTEETIRRDLKEIEKQGIAIRSHGGALLNYADQVKPFSERETINHDLKTKIALCVQDFIEDGMVIMVDASTTTKIVIEHIDNAKHLTIITNSYTLIDQLSSALEVICASLQLGESATASTRHMWDRMRCGQFSAITQIWRS